MLHRIVKKHDVSKDKWIGVGGHFELGESPEECLLREVEEETGLKLTSYRFRGIVTFLCDVQPPEYMCLYTADGFTGEMCACDEGTLEWVGKDKIQELNLWEGDNIFFRLIEDDVPFFSLKLRYEGNTLKEAGLNGKPLELFDILEPDGTPTGRIRERTAVHRDGDLHGTSHVWVIRQKSGPSPDSGDYLDSQKGWEVLLQKRARGKDAFPGCWDISAAGHMPAGSTFIETACRELEEELGITASEHELELIGMHDGAIDTQFYGRPFRNHELSAVYVYSCPARVLDFTLQKEEVEAVRWVDMDECLQMVEKDLSPHCIFRDEMKMLRDYLKAGN